ncbi:MAG: hypothetical protein IJ222_03975 [Bacteroidales bacterium]|nr:hypothetical protein [Bacteroidales bacterium]
MQPREFIYTDKRNLDDYLDNDLLNEALYEDVLLDVKEANQYRYFLKMPILEVFNIAYYICAKMQEDSHPEEQFYEKYWSAVDCCVERKYEIRLVLSLAYAIIALQADQPRNYRYFLSSCEKRLCDDNAYFPYFKEFVEKTRQKGMVFTSDFTWHGLDVSFTKEELLDMDWDRKTDNFNESIIKRYISAGKTVEEQLNVLDAIKSKYVSANTQYPAMPWDDDPPIFPDTSFFDSLREEVEMGAYDLPSPDDFDSPTKTVPIGEDPRISQLQGTVDAQQQTIIELQQQIDALQVQRSETRSIKIRAIYEEAKSYPDNIRSAILTMLRALIADQDENWIERIKAEEDRIASFSSSDNEVSSKKTLCLGVATDLMLLLLRKAGISAYADNTKMAALIAAVTDYSPEKIRQRLSGSVPVTKRHQSEIDAVNQILADLNIPDKLPDAR